MNNQVFLSGCVYDWTHWIYVRVWVPQIMASMRSIFRLLGKIEFISHLYNAHYAFLVAKKKHYQDKKCDDLLEWNIPIGMWFLFCFIERQQLAQLIRLNNLAILSHKQLRPMGHSGQLVLIQPLIKHRLPPKEHMLVSAIRKREYIRVLLSS